MGFSDGEDAPEGTVDDTVGCTNGDVLGADEALGESLRIALGDADTLGFPEGEELGAFDNDGALEGMAEELGAIDNDGALEGTAVDKLGRTDGDVL